MGVLSTSCFVFATFSGAVATFMAMDRGAPPSVFFPRMLLTVAALGGAIISASYL